jgi:transcriptional regulator GlxA family with amidase domain
MPILIMVPPGFSPEVARKGAGRKDNTIAFPASAVRLEAVRRATKRVWFLVVPRTGLLDIAGPWEVLGHANDVLGRPAYRLELRGPRTPATETRYGLVVNGLRPLPRRVPQGGLPDLAIVAGAPVNQRPGEQTALVAWLRRFHARIPTLVSICTGAFVLGAAGVLDGRRATTHWMSLDQLRARVPTARVVDEGIFVHDRGVWTSAGVTAGIDLTLALVEADHGREVAMAVARRLVLFLRRSGHQAQFSAALARQEKGPPELRDISSFVVEHLDEPLAVDRIAAGVGMSARTLSRWCRQHLGEAPAELVRRLRLDEARRLLEETDLPLKEITARTGLGDTSTLWRVFTRRLGVTPAVYRERFARQRVAAAG